MLWYIWVIVIIAIVFVLVGLFFAVKDWKSEVDPPMESKLERLFWCGVIVFFWWR